MKLSGAEIVVETLIEQNVKTIFGYPGGTVLDIYDQLYKKSDRITHVLTAHEQGADIISNPRHARTKEFLAGY